MGYERENISMLAAYTPGEQPGAGSARWVKLNTNENPYPPCREVLDAIRAVDGEQLRRYPPPAAPRCRAAAAQTHSLSPEQVIVTNGGDELLRMAVTVFCKPRGGKGNSGGGLGMATPSYSLYPVLANIHDTPLTSVPLGNDFDLPGDFADRLNREGCKLAMIVNPHAPSGRLEPLDKLGQIAKEFRGVLLIDEAYVDFATGDALGLLSPASGVKNVLLLRTLSKGYSLAGLRFGYGLGHPGLIAALDKARDSYNTDVLSQAAAVAALTHRDKAQVTWEKVKQERARLSQELANRGYKVYPSQSNFLLVVPTKPASRVYESLKAGGVLVRYFDQGRLHDKLRVTVGRPDENDALLKAIDSL